MRSTVRIASLLILWLWAAPALAQDDTTPTVTPETDEATELAERLLPEFRPCTVDGERFACYTAEQQLQLNVLEENARTWRNQLLITTQLHLDQAALVVNLTAQLSEEREIVTAERARNEALTAQLMEEIEEKNRYRAEADSTDWWPLLVGGVVGLLGAGVAIGVAIVAAVGGFDSTTSTSP
jgi:hypothetical protein